jgi:5'-3' exonuclease
VIVHLIDGTYELFRHFYAVPKARDKNGVEVAAVRGVIGSLRGMLNSRVATHMGVATDHVIESFRNDLWPGYKTGDGIDPDLLSQFHLLEEALVAFGIVVWPMVEYEADDALAAAALKAASDPRVTQVHLHAGQGSVAMRQRHAHRPGRPAAPDHSRRSRSDCQVRRPSGIDP